MLTGMNRPGLEPFTPELIAVLPRALEQSTRLGHGYLGSEHLLLAVAAANHPVGAILRAHGVTPQRVEQEIIRHIGLGAGAGLLGGLDRDALAAIGIDLDTVRARIESSFGPETLTHAGHTVQRETRARPAWHRPSLSTALIRRWHRHRRTAMEPIPLRAATGLWRRDRGAAVFLPFTLSARRSLESIRREARARRNTTPGVEHVALALISMTNGPVPVILASLGVTPRALRTAILNGYRQAS
jgi:ATP-dependent Clp protease ATP-binding subunit ClpA